MVVTTSIWFEEYYHWPGDVIVCGNGFSFNVHATTLVIIINTPIMPIVESKISPSLRAFLSQPSQLNSKTLTIKLSEFVNFNVALEFFRFLYAHAHNDSIETPPEDMFLTIEEYFKFLQLVDMHLDSNICTKFVEKLITNIVRYVESDFSLKT